MLFFQVLKFYERRNHSKEISLSIHSERWRACVDSEKLEIKCPFRNIQLTTAITDLRSAECTEDI
jgi:hypothetical protein